MAAVALPAIIIDSSERSTPQDQLTIINKTPPAPTKWKDLKQEEIKQKILEKLSQIATLLLHSTKSLDPEIMNLLYSNCIPEFLTEQALDDAFEAALSYNREKRDKIRVTSTWRTYAKPIGGPFVTTDDVALISPFRLSALACSLGIFPYTITVYRTNQELHGVSAIRVQIRCAIDSIINTPILKVYRAISPSNSSLYDMKRVEILDDLQVIDKAVTESQCSLFKQYRTGKFLGAGTYGAVVELFPINSSLAANSKAYALKVQYLREEKNIASAAYEEIRTHDLIMQGIPNGTMPTTICNVVKLFDWTKCKTNLGNLFASFPPKRSWWNGPDFQRAKTYQFSVLELVTEGDYYNYFKKEPDEAYRLGSLRSFFTQLLCTLSQLQDARRFTHFDLHLPNVLRQKLPDIYRDAYLHYNIRGKDLYVPLNDSNGSLVKLNDFGMAYCEYYADDNLLPRVSCGGYWYFTDEGDASRFNPRYDLHSIACSVLERLLSNAMDKNAHSHAPSDVIILIFLMINARWIGTTETRLHENVTKAIDLMIQISKSNDPQRILSAPESIAILSVASSSCTTLRTALFNVDEEPSSWIVTLLEYKLFDSYRLIPDKRARIIQMDVSGRIPQKI